LLRFGVLGFALGAVACGYKEKRFVDESAEAYCALLGACGLTADIDGCVGSYGDPRPSDECGYDPEAAAACVEAWETADCGTSYPVVCDVVYTECP
jgi:hypothetical protein